MAKYKKRADGRYSNSITITVDGVKKQRTVYGKTVREVDDKIAELRAQANKGAVVDDRSVTFTEWAEVWLNHKRSNVTYNTFSGYENCVRVHILPAIGDKRLKEIKKYHLQKIIDNLSEKDKIATAIKAKVTLCQLISEAVENDYIYKDVSKNLTTPKKGENKKRALSSDEIKNIQSADLPLMQRAFVDTLLYTGIRRGEALALTVDDIDINSKKISINKTVIFGKNQSSLQMHPKTVAGYREIPIPQSLCDELSELVGISDRFLFTKKNGDMMTKTSLRRFWEQVCKNIEASTGEKLNKDVTPHLFRHTYATKLFYAGVDVKTAQYLLGHSSVQVTLGIYTHLESDNLKKFENVVDDIFA